MVSHRLVFAKLSALRPQSWGTSFLSAHQNSFCDIRNVLGNHAHDIPAVRMISLMATSKWGDIACHEPPIFDGTNQEAHARGPQRGGSGDWRWARPARHRAGLMAAARMASSQDLAALSSVHPVARAPSETEEDSEAVLTPSQYMVGRDFIGIGVCRVARPRSGARHDRARDRGCSGPPSHTRGQRRRLRDEL
jgi:hypothetical protein